MVVGPQKVQYLINGKEVYSIAGIASGLVPDGRVTVRAQADDGKATAFQAVVRLNSPVEVEYLLHGGILPRVLRLFLARQADKPLVD